MNLESFTPGSIWACRLADLGIPARGRILVEYLERNEMPHETEMFFQPVGTARVFWLSQDRVMEGDFQPYQPQRALSPQP